MASDKESAVVDEHAKISGHFSRRFRKHILLNKHDNISHFCKAHVYVAVQFYPWFKFYFPLF